MFIFVSLLVLIAYEGYTMKKKKSEAEEKKAVEKKKQ